MAGVGVDGTKGSAIQVGTAQVGTALRAPTIDPIVSIEQLRQWQFAQEIANVAQVPLAKRAEIPATAMPTLMGFDMGEFQYDPWFTQWSQGARGAEGKRSAGNVFNFSFWQYVDISYYMGANLLTIPPTVWTNAAHKNGVRSLGTLNLNWPDEEQPQVFTQEEVKYLLTAKPANFDKSKLYLDDAINLLKAIAKYYGFDGYLIKAEKRFSDGTTDQYRPGMLKLLHDLKAGGLISVWYDSPFSNGDFANYLNEGQWDFLEAASYFQTSYFWGPYGGGGLCKNITPKLSWDVLEAHDKDQPALQNRNRVFTGLDCSIHRGSPPYKPDFFSALSLIKSTENPPNYFTAFNLYYPAWVMYDLRKNGTGQTSDELPSRINFHNNEQAFWAGSKDFIDYPNAGVNPIAPDQCMSHYLHERTAITSMPFSSCFNDGEGDFYNVAGETKSENPWNNLSDQSILPTFRYHINGGIRKNNKTAIIHGNPDLVYNGGSSLSIDLEGLNEVTIDLFRLQVKWTPNITVALTLKSPKMEVMPVIFLKDRGSEQMTVTRTDTLKNGWVRYHFNSSGEWSGTATAIQLNIKASNPKSPCILGEVSIIDHDKTIPSPWRKTFPASVTELDWKTSYDPTSHYRIYGVLADKTLLVGIAYNYRFRVKYGEHADMKECDHIFNMDTKGFTSYIVQEVNAGGDFTPI